MYDVKENQKLKWLYRLLWIFCGIVFGFVIKTYLFKAPSLRGNITRQGQSEFINPILGCDISDQKEFYEFKPLKESVNGKVEEELRSKRTQSISVYFRLLNTGRWFSINEQEEYSPASLMKVPVMMAYYKLSNTHPEIMWKELYWDGVDNLNTMEQIRSSSSLKVGMYSVKDLINQMIVYSDNNAARLLTNNLEKNPSDIRALQDIYTDLGLTMPKGKTDINSINVKTYAFIFRVLYGATYLPRDKSSEALKLLSETEFKEGIVKGVPSSVKVAHKFGEREIVSIEIAPTKTKVQESQELHDCGIIYYPKHPYILCIMTKGKDIDSLKNTLVSISETVYMGVEKFFKNE